MEITHFDSTPDGQRLSGDVPVLDTYQLTFDRTYLC
jgi:hypothetical protein